MKVVKFENFEAYENSVSDNGAQDNVLYVVFDGSWVRVDMTVSGENVKPMTIVKKFAKALEKANVNELDGWGEGMVESAENGYFDMDEKDFFSYGVQDNYVWLCVKVK